MNPDDRQIYYLQRYSGMYIYIHIRRLKKGIRSEKCTVRRFRRCENVYLHQLSSYSLLHT